MPNDDDAGAAPDGDVFDVMVSAFSAAANVILRTAEFTLVYAGIVVVAILSGSGWLAVLKVFCLSHSYLKVSQNIVPQLTGVETCGRPSLDQFY